MFAAGCAPKLTVHSNQAAGQFPPTQLYESFAILESDTLQIPGQILISNLEFKDKGFTIDCDYETIKRLVADQARQLGGNCMIITEHRFPDIVSSCHRIKCKVLRIPEPEQYEKTISWDTRRPLKISNFKGSTEKRPFQAETYSTLRYFAKPNPLSGKSVVVVESAFDCDLSYFIPSDRDSAVLGHEQLHFDITELYARKFRKMIVTETPRYKMFLADHERLFAAILKEWQLKQDEYDSEVYADRSKQAKWNTWVQEELLKYKDFENREVILGSK